jgi:MATE family multidrug resistance protein
MTTPVESTPLPRSVAVRPGAGGVREVALLAYPVILSQLSMTTMGVVDSAMVGRLGPTELAAVGFASVWLWTLTCGFVGTGTGVQTFVAQHHGAGETERCGAFAWQGLYAVMPPMLLAAGLLFLGVAPFMALLGPSETLRPLAIDYMSVRVVGSVGICAATVLASFFRGIGDTRTPLYATLAANALNVVLDYGLIFGRLGLPQWGVVGAGTATAISEWLYAGLLLYAFRRPAVSSHFATSMHPPEMPAIRRLLRVGIPVGGQWMLEMLSFAVFLVLVARMGDVSMAASQIYICLLSLSFMQAMGLAMAVATLVGRYVGARDQRSAERSLRTGLRMTWLLAGGVALLFVSVPEALMRIFSADPEVIALGRPLLALGAAYQLFDALGIVIDGALRGAGDTRWPFLVRFALAWGLFLPLAWLLAVLLDGGLTGAWLSGAVYVVAIAAVLAWRFRSGAWQRIQI